MTTQNIGIVFGPTLMRPERDNGNMAVNMIYQNQAVELILQEFDYVFGKRGLSWSWNGKKYAPPDKTEVQAERRLSSVAAASWRSQQEKGQNAATTDQRSSCELQKTRISCVHWVGPRWFSFTAQQTLFLDLLDFRIFKET